MRFGSTQLTGGNDTAGERDGFAILLGIKRATMWDFQIWIACDDQPRFYHSLPVPHQIETSFIRRILCIATTGDNNSDELPRLTSISGRIPAADDGEGVWAFRISLWHDARTTWPGLLVAASPFVLRNRVRAWQIARMAKAPPVKWTREHTLIALNLYCKLPFSKFTNKNPIIIEVAAKMGRNTNSLAMKLCNFASLDPVHRARGVKGLEGASNQDKAMWKEFHENIPILGEQSEQLLHDLFTHDEAKEVDFLARDKVRLVTPTGPTEIQATVKVRRGQQFFRQSILNAYGVSCCISGINVPRLLVASHIKPWRHFPAERLDPRNGLCLSSLHDAAFDSGLITLDEKLNVVLSKRLKKFFPQPALEQSFVPFEGQRIQLPNKLAEPSQDFLGYHREEVFQN